MLSVMERRQAERAASESEFRFRLVVESSPNAIVMADREGKIVLVNAKTEELFGYKRNELIGQPVEMLVPLRFRDQHPTYRKDFSTDPKTRPMGAGRDLFGLRKDGSQVPVEIGLNPISTDEGTFVLASVVDITERKRAEERFRLVVESSPNGIVMVNSKGEIVLVNSQIERLFGYSRQELIGRRIEVLVPPEFREKHPDYRKGFSEDPHSRPMGAGRDLFGLRKDGTRLPVEIGLNPVRSDEGVFTLASIVDITERKRTEDALIKQARELEQFAYVSSHDLQEPLRKVASYAQMLSGELAHAASPQVEKCLANILQGTERMQTLIRDLLDYSRLSRQERRREEVPLNNVVKRVLEDLESSIKENQADVSVGDLPIVQADPVLMNQLIQNLVSNAIKFHGDEPPKIEIFARGADDGWTVCVRDNGIGIDPRYTEQIFKVFQRLHSKGRYQGTGIGLAICKKIVEQHGGRIWVEPTPGGGSTFCFSIPRPVIPTEQGNGRHHDVA